MVTEQEMVEIFEVVASRVDASDLGAWKRKIKKMEKLLAEMQPIEEEILKLVVKKQPIFDQIQELRNEMVKMCIHPTEHLALEGKTVICKFCDKRLQVKHGQKKASK